MFNIFKKISWFMKENWKWFLIVAFADIIAGSISVITPKIIGNTIDLMAINQLTWSGFIRSCGLLLALMVIGYFCAVTWVYHLYELGLKFENHFRSKFYNHVMKMGGDFFKKYAVGDLMVRATTDLKQVAIVTSDGFFFLLEGTVYLILIIVGMLFTGNWFLTLITIVPLGLITFFLSTFGDKIREKNTVAQQKLSELSESLLESVRGVQVIRAYRQQQHNYEQLADKTEQTRDLYAKVDFYDNLTTLIVYIGFGFVEVLIVYLGIQMVFRGEMTAGNLVTFVLYLNMLSWPMNALSSVFGVLKRGESSYERIEEVLQKEPAIVENKQQKIITEFHKLEFRNYQFRYPDAKVNEYALQDINFTLNEGETLGVVGKVGGGRTTLLRQLLGEYALENNETILLNDEVFDTYTISSIRNLMGYVPQEHVLFSKSVEDNLKVAKIDATDAEINRAIDLADFRKDLAFLDGGIKAKTGESGTLLSGGQKQRLAIARAFLGNPAILILDDALSAVDGKTEAKIIQNIILDRQNQTNIIIAHRLSAVAHADKIIVLDDGKIIEHGNHQELLALDGWYKEQYVYQSMEHSEEFEEGEE